MNAALSLACACLLAACATVAEREPMRCEILTAGSIDRVPDDRVLVSLNDRDPRLLGKIGSNVRFSSVGSRIRTRPGSGFGVAHRFFGGERDDLVEVVLTHPPIDYGAGATTQTRWRKPAGGKGTSFFFDLEAERVAGTWTFAFLDGDREICRQAFVVE